MKTSLLLVSATLALSALPAFAHHSTAMFDGQKLVVLKGTMRQFSYLNPHSWISVVAAPDGKGEAARWDIEASAPAQLERMGITPATFKPGDKVTFGIRPLKDGRRGGAFVFAVTASKIYGAKPESLGLSAADLQPK